MGTGTFVSFGLLLVAAGCGRCGGDDAPAADPGGCSPGVWGVPAVDRLVSLGGDEPLVYETSIEALLASPEAGSLADALRDVATANLAALSVEARATLQHDLWGLVHRLAEHDASSELRDELLAAARAAATHAAPTADALTPLSARDADATVARHLPPEDGWVERGSEMPVLGHERHFGLRRIFRVFERTGAATDRPTGRALVSQLVALDRDGTPHLTPVIGEIEILALEGDTARGERVLHLDRRRLRCDGPGGALVDLAAIAHIPGVGADSFLVEPTPPAPLADNPCAECHEDAFAMSLPSPEIDPRERERRLMSQVAESIAVGDRALRGPP